jgi:hypothetical protein
MRAKHRSLFLHLDRSLDQESVFLAFLLNSKHNHQALPKKKKIKGTVIEPLINRNENIVLFKQGHLPSPLSYSLINNLASIRAGVFFAGVDKLSKEKAVEEIKPFLVLIREFGLQMPTTSKEGRVNLGERRDN